jgi:hypothetical protein
MRSVSPLTSINARRRNFWCGGETLQVARFGRQMPRLTLRFTLGFVAEEGGEGAASTRSGCGFGRSRAPRARAVAERKDFTGTSFLLALETGATVGADFADRSSVAVDAVDAGAGGLGGGSAAVGCVGAARGSGSGAGDSAAGRAADWVVTSWSVGGALFVSSATSQTTNATTPSAPSAASCGRRLR